MKMKRKYKTCSVASAKTQARYVGEKLPLYAKGNVVGVQLGNDASYFGTDMIGSVRSVTDGYGSVKNLREYDVFGNLLETCGYNSGLEYGYAGKSYDAITEMYNYGFRDYSPATARFTTLDPIRDGTNWFSYVANDPVNFVDLWGLAPKELNNAITKHLAEEYTPSTNDCNVWVEKVILEAYPNSELKDKWGEADSYTSNDHTIKLNDYFLSGVPSDPGVYLAFQYSSKDPSNAIHSFMISINEDKTVELAQMTRNPEGGKTADGKGYSELVKYNSFDEFNQGWGKLGYVNIENGFVSTVVKQDIKDDSNKIAKNSCTK